jgi:hypothetical protein
MRECPWCGERIEYGQVWRASWSQTRETQCQKCNGRVRISGDTWLKQFIVSTIAMGCLIYPHFAHLPIVPQAIRPMLFAVLDSASFQFTWLLGTGIGGHFYVLHVASFERGPSRLTCRKCGYDLRGSPSGVCPECGTRFKPSQHGVSQDRR